MGNAEKTEWRKIPLLQDTLVFSRAELEDRVDKYIAEAPEELYCSDIVDYDKRCSREGGYMTEAGSFCEIIANKVCDSSWTVSKNPNSTYSAGRRKELRDRCAHLKNDLLAMERYIVRTDRAEPRMCHCFYIQETIDGFEAIDYELPTVKKGDKTANTGKIDLVLKKGDAVYITEVKYFGSDESLLRCVLEIQTYYMTLNERFRIGNITRDTVKKAVLFDESSYAFSQLELPWAKRLLEKFEIKVLILSKDEKAFHIREYN